MSGAWREKPLEWYAEPKDSCEVCGRLIPSRRWVFAGSELCRIRTRTLLVARSLWTINVVSARRFTTRPGRSGTMTGFRRRKKT